MNRFLKQFSLPLSFVTVVGILIVTGSILSLVAPAQVVLRKMFLIGAWYVIGYSFRRQRLGEIQWGVEGDWDRKIYYFVILICVAMIIAFG